MEKILNDEKPVAQIIVFGGAGDWKPKSLDEYLTVLRKDLPEQFASPARWNTDEIIPFLIVSASERETIEKSLLAGGHFKVERSRPLTAQQLVDLGKGVRLQQLK